ncbi:hypothetical protein [Nonomuraea sp. CA-141351]|uniref:hypothetical protein n=1 Tax=Nonomuraea sp. CA-141351 TaxID=3239996 RepID=UPI003D8F25E2
MANQLVLNVIVPGPARHDVVSTQLLVDGRDLLRGLFPAGPGDDPDYLLDRLVPQPEPHEARLAEAPCTEGCCGALYVTVRQEGDVIIWNEWRNPDNPHLDAPELRFSRSAYLAELERADRERAWEWIGRTFARLLREQIHRNPEVLLQWDCTLDFVECLPWERDRVRLFITSPRRQQIRQDTPWNQYGIFFDATGDPVEQQANSALAALKDRDPRTWADRVGGSR